MPQPDVVHIVTLTYVRPLEEADAVMAEHLAWVARGYDDGVFLASGRSDPRTGGVILATGDRTQLEQRVEQDPFVRRRIATSSVSTFVPSRWEA